jgi:membrane protease YdiL (CAAX protease family)
MDENPWGLLALILAQNLLLLGAVLGIYWGVILVLRLSGRKRSFSPAPLGIASPQQTGVIGGAVLGIFVGGGIVILNVLVSAAAMPVLRELGFPTTNQAQQPLFEGVTGLVRQSPELAIPAVVFTIIIAGPAAEELFFRGAIFGGLYRLGKAITGGVRTRLTDVATFLIAALISSGLFASLHLSPAIVPGIFVLALVLCYFYRRTGSLLTPFVAHATFNSFTTAALILSAFGYIPQGI